MKKLLLAALAILGMAGRVQALGPVISYVKMSTGATQSGGFNTSTGTVGNLTVSTFTVSGPILFSSNTVLSGATFYQNGPFNTSVTENHTGTVNMTGSVNLSGLVTASSAAVLGGPTFAVRITSNTILAGSTFYAGGANTILGPVTFSSAPFSNWTTYTPTFAGLGTVSSTSAFWRRIGDTIEIQGYTVAGTVAASAFSISLPTSLSMDTTKIHSDSSLGFAHGGSSGLTFWSDNLTGVLFYDGSDATKVFAAKTATTSMVKLNGSSLLGASSNECTFKFSAPISGWSF